MSEGETVYMMTANELATLLSAKPRDGKTLVEAAYEAEVLKMLSIFFEAFISEPKSSSERLAKGLAIARQARTVALATIEE